MYTTYDVFDDLMRMRNMFDSFFTETPSILRKAEYPYVKLYAKEDELEIKAIVPGARVEDLDLQLIDNSLIIKGEKKTDYKDKPYIRKERAFGKFQKSVKLPHRVDPNNIQAAMKNGLLTVKLNKSEEAKMKHIEIK